MDSIWGSKTVLGSTHVVEQISYSMFPSILTFDSDLILWSFFTFWGLSRLLFEFDLILGPWLTFRGPNGLFLGLREGLTSVSGSTHVVEQLSFSMFPSIMTFDLDLILGSFFTFGDSNRLFLGWGHG